jgi:putative ABC transport system permease protein
VQGAIMVGAVSQEATPRAARQITALLRDRHKIQAGMDDDFSIRDVTELTSAVSAGTMAVAALLAAVAAMSLLVGGIGITNIMLVSVTERTHEIGVRRAVGARRRSILGQFLAEAVVLSMAGGTVGIMLGVATAAVVAVRVGIAIPVSASVIGVALGFSAAVGIAFGLYPAQRASRLSPIDALRHE